MNIPLKSEEIHLVTPAGKVTFICETVERAMIHMSELKPIPTDWRILKVTTQRVDVTPPRTKSSILHEIARERGVPVIDFPLAKVG